MLIKLQILIGDILLIKVKNQFETIDMVSKVSNLELEKRKAKKMHEFKKQN